MAITSLLRIGVITAAHGIRGQVKIRSFAEPPQAIFSCGALSDGEGRRAFKLIRNGISGNSFIASIEGIHDRNAAEQLKGAELYVQAGALPRKAEGRYYSHELTGLEARLEDGTVFGTVQHMHDFGAGEILEIRLKDGKSEMFAFTPDNFPEIDIKAGWLTIHPPEEL